MIYFSQEMRIMNEEELIKKISSEIDIRFITTYVKLLDNDPFGDLTESEVGNFH